MHIFNSNLTAKMECIVYMIVLIIGRYKWWVQNKTVYFKVAPKTTILFISTISLAVQDKMLAKRKKENAIKLALNTHA